MPARVPPDAATNVSETWSQYQADDHQRRLELIQIWFAVTVLAVLTGAGLYLAVLQPEASPDQVKLAYGWIGAVLGAATNMLRKP
jgi:hypothetical protein